MRRVYLALPAIVFVLYAQSCPAAEEHIRGVLEKTAKSGASAQITDALNETYFVTKTPEGDKWCQDLMGKRVVLTGTVEQQTGDTAYFLRLTKAELFQPKMPPAPAPAAPSTESGPLPPPAKQEPSAGAAPQHSAPGTNAPKE